MKLSDSNNREILEGCTVKYLRTHTVGKVEEICTREGVEWIKIDKTGLYYRKEYLEVLEQSETPMVKKNISAKDKILLKIARSRMNVRNAGTEISDHPDGPGYGGG
jgi:hypothetical protein